MGVAARLEARAVASVEEGRELVFNRPEVPWAELRFDAHTDDAIEDRLEGVQISGLEPETEGVRSCGERSVFRDIVCFGRAGHDHPHLPMAGVDAFVYRKNHDGRAPVAVNVSVMRHTESDG